jgi:hypothetical protein
VLKCLSFGGNKAASTNNNGIIIFIVVQQHRQRNQPTSKFFEAIRKGNILGIGTIGGYWIGSKLSKFVESGQMEMVPFPLGFNGLSGSWAVVDFGFWFVTGTKVKV